MEVPATTIPAKCQAEFGAMGKNLFGGCEGQLEYGFQGVEGHFVFHFLLPRIGKETIQTDHPPPFLLDKTSNEKSKSFLQ